MLAHVAENFAQAGPLRTVELLSSKTTEAGRSLRYRSRHENDSLLVSALIDATGQFRELRFSLE